MEQHNTLLIEFLLKIDDWDEFHRLMLNEEYQVISSGIYYLRDED